eukprot:TRINITY_DN8457_c0_g1_i2.p1 TRINITY_DN8457_c0_g1~~TRINITY_DN8457_c0_g1_i2.p1  ORF type:complete len:746 (+),score=166.76 TRINITY_DN8457_c0_g1_i2:114-2351(+)
MDTNKKFKRSSKGLCGLVNLGNTCFLNSTVQALTHCKPLTRYFRKALTLESRDDVVQSYTHLIRTQWDGKSSAIKPYEFVRAIFRRNPIFQGYGQQDSQEFLRCLLDCIHEALKQEVCINSTQPKYESIITDIFEGQLLSRVQCCACGKISESKDMFLDLSVSIPDQQLLQKISTEEEQEEHFRERNQDILEHRKKLEQTGWLGWMGYKMGISNRTVYLEDCIKGFCTKEELCGDDKYKCESCKTYNDSHKFFRIVKPPEILCLQIKRFRHDGMSMFGGGGKLYDIVKFPLGNFDISSICETPKSVRRRNGEIAKKRAEYNMENGDDEMKVNGKQSADDKENGIEDGDDKEDPLSSTEYDLIAVINHQGGLNGGHYISYALHKGRNQWFKFDDYHVEAVTPEEVENVEAYILFYQRKTSDVKKQERAEIKAKVRQMEIRKRVGGLDKINEKIAYIPKEWWNKWKTMEMPGRIQWGKFMCKHGNLKAIKSDWLVPVPRNIYLGFVENYGLNLNHHCKQKRKNTKENGITKNGERNTDNETEKDEQNKQNGGKIFMVTNLSAIIDGCQTCKNEKRMLNEQRDEENYVINIIDRQSAHPGEWWNLITTKWLDKWTLWADNKGPLPGPIDNSDLLIHDSTGRGSSLSQRKPKKGLELAEDYKGVVPDVWNYLVSVHGGGPELASRGDAPPDLYRLTEINGNSPFGKKWKDVVREYRRKNGTDMNGFDVDETESSELEVEEEKECDRVFK